MDNDYIYYINCPYCGATISSSAYRCDCCGNILPDPDRQARGETIDTHIDPPEETPDSPYLYNQPRFKQRKPAPQKEESHTGLWVLVTLCGIFFVFGIVFLIMSSGNKKSHQRTARNYSTTIIDSRSGRTESVKSAAAESGPNIRKTYNKGSGAVWMLDLVNRDALILQTRELKLGSRFPASYKTTRGIRIGGFGHINTNDVKVDIYLEPNGEIHGRYFNENGTKLDVNGYIDTNGHITIQLGHGSETSHWTLLNEEGFRYSGFWGKKSLPSSMTFHIQ